MTFRLLPIDFSFNGCIIEPYKEIETAPFQLFDFLGDDLVMSKLAHRIEKRAVSILVDRIMAERNPADRKKH